MKTILSKRQTEVLQLLVDGKTSGEIAASLERSEKTIHKHIERLMEKYSARTRSQMIARAAISGIVRVS